MRKPIMDAKPIVSVPAMLAMMGGFMLIGCATRPAQLPPPAPVSAPVCLPLKAYTPDQQKALAAQLKTIPADSPLAQAIVDYERMRDSDRAVCLKQ